MASRANARIKSYKNKALDSQEMRRRREEEGIQLRKTKREEQVSDVQNSTLTACSWYMIFLSILSLFGKCNVFPLSLVFFVRCLKEEMLI